MAVEKMELLLYLTYGDTLALDLKLSMAIWPLELEPSLVLKWHPLNCLFGWGHWGMLRTMWLLYTSQDISSCVHQTRRSCNHGFEGSPWMRPFTYRWRPGGVATEFYLWHCTTMLYNILTWLVTYIYLYCIIVNLVW